jgi:hypothetical protein
MPKVSKLKVQETLSEEDARARMAALSEPDVPDEEIPDGEIPGVNVEPAAAPTSDAEDDADEAEFRAIRKDIPGVKGAGGKGIVTISVGKIPTKNEFFRTHADWNPITPIVDHEVGIEKQFFAVTPDMVANLAAIGITVSDFLLYLTVTSRGSVRIIPVRQETDELKQDEYSRTKEIGLVRGRAEWVRLFHDQENRSYQVFPAPADRFGEPQWPDLKPGKIFRLAFRDKGRLIDSTEHPLFLKWSARDTD